MLDYVQRLGIDVTSEYIYRELPLRADADNHPVRKYYGLYEKDLPVGSWKDAPIHTLGRIPAVWWMSNMTIDDCINIQPSELSGYLNDAVVKTAEKVSGIYPMQSSQMQKYITLPQTETNISVMLPLPIIKFSSALNRGRRLL